MSKGRPEKMKEIYYDTLCMSPFLMKLGHNKSSVKTSLSLLLDSVGLEFDTN